jgi:putative copper resistance protein D
MGLTPGDFFVKAHVAPLDLAVLALGVAWFVWSRRRLAGRGRSWPAGRTLCFVLAVLAFAVAACSGLSAFAPTNFSAFGTQYILAGLVAPAFLALAAPLSLGLQASERPDRGRVLATPFAKVVAGPVTTWVGFTATVFLVFFSGARQTALTGSGLAQQAILLWMLAAGWLFLWPVADVDPMPRRIGYWPRILYLLLIFPVFAIMGMGLESQSDPISPVMTLGSLHLGAAVVWVAGETLALIGSIAVFVQWLRADERRARGHDLANEQVAARQLAVWRASREAAARAASQ